MKYLANGIFSLLFVAILGSCQAQNNAHLSAEQFAKQIDAAKSLQLLDVRTPGEYSEGHLANALQADYTDKAEFSRRIAFIDKNKPVYVYCLSGGRSGAAAKEMRAAGYQNVYELTGGINAWKAANKPVEGQTKTASMTVAQLDATLQQPGIVLVDFGAEWCPPCKKMEPVLEALQAAHPGKITLVKVDGGRDLVLLKKYAVTALPVFIYFKNGQIIWRRDGVATQQEMEAALANH